MIIPRLTISLLALFALAGSVFAGDFCDLAVDVTEKAIVTFETDQNDALKLFIIARELCPTDAASAYNLGVAYFRYGSLDEAQESFEEAVRRDDRNAGALNNLAQVILERQGDVDRALEYAEQAAELDKSAATQETLARARFAAGKDVEALEGLHEALTELPEPRLKASYDDLLNRYLSARLEKIKTGRQL